MTEIIYVVGDVLAPDRGIIAHGVNCRGVMGAGVAKQIANRWPIVLKKYRRFIETSLKETGTVPLGKTQLVLVEDGLYVANCFTQPDIYPVYPLTTAASPDAIVRAFGELNEHANLLGLPVHVPAIGCGLGGLSWTNDVEPILSSIDWSVDVFVHHFGELDLPPVAP